MVQAEGHAVVLQQGGDTGAQSNRIYSVRARDGRVIPLWHPPPQLLDDRADPNSPGIAGQVSACPARRGRRKVVLQTTNGDDSLPQCVTRHDASDLHRLREPANLVVPEEKGLIFFERPTKARSRPVVVLWLPGDTVRVIVPGVGVQGRILVIPIGVPMKTVSPAFADHIDLAARRAPEACIIVGYADAELFNGVHADRHDRHLVSSARDHVVGDVDAVEVESVLIAACASHSPARISETAAIRRFIGCRCRLQRQQLARIPLQGWQVHHCRASHHFAHHRVRRLQSRARFRGHRDRLADLPDLQLDVYRVALGHFHRERLLYGPESFFFYRDAIVPRSHVRESVLPHRVGLLRGLAVDGGVLQQNARPGNDRASRIVHRSHYPARSDRLSVIAYRAACHRKKKKHPGDQ